MTRQRIIKQYGNTWVIKLEPIDVIDFGLVEGDKIDIEDLITPDEIIPRYQEWIVLYSKYDGLEKEFFKPYWLPLQRNSYEYFLDISDNQYPVFSFFFMPFEPYSYSKQMLFDSISAFMLLEDNEYEIKRLKDHKFNEMMLHVKKLFKDS